jgi:hypothetical protein
MRRSNWAHLRRVIAVVVALPDAIYYFRKGYKHAGQRQNKPGSSESSPTTPESPDS